VVIDLRASGPPAVRLPEVVTELVKAGANATCLVSSDSIVDQLQRCLGARDERKATVAVDGLVVELILGDVTKVEADALVNASNTRLQLGGGVSGAFKNACDAGLQAEMYAAGGIEPGGLAVSGPHGLANTRRILHVATAGGGKDVVAKAMSNILAFAERAGMDSVAIPGLGMGTGGLAAADCAQTMLSEIRMHQSRVPNRALKLILVLWLGSDYNAFCKVFGA